LRKRRVSDTDLAAFGSRPQADKLCACKKASNEATAIGENGKKSESSPVSLLWGPRCNILEWRDFIYNECLKHHGTLAKFMLMEAPTYTEDQDFPDPNPNDFNLAERADVIKFETKLKMVTSKKETLVCDRPHMYARIWETLSETSKEKVTQDIDYEDFRSRCDPLDLWIAIINSHLTSATGNPMKDREDAVRKYQNLYQGSEESLLAYKNRFIQAYASLSSVGVAHPPSHEEQAIHFLNMLDKSRFGELQLTMHNNVTTGTSSPYLRES
jgi:hypothetical protein